MQHSSLDYLLFVIQQARQSVRLNLMLEFLVQFTLASLFWAYFVVEQRKAHSSFTADGKDQAPRASSSEKLVTSPSEPRTRERARSRDDGGVEETGEAADKRRNGKDKNGLNRSSDNERDKDSSASETKQLQDGAKASDEPRGRRAGSALRTLFLRSLVLYSVVTCSIIFYAFCTWPFSNSWPYYLTFISPLFLVCSPHANPVAVALPLFAPWRHLNQHRLARVVSDVPGSVRVSWHHRHGPAGRSVHLLREQKRGAAGAACPLQEAAIGQRGPPHHQHLLPRGTTPIFFS